MKRQKERWNTTLRVWWCEASSEGRIRMLEHIDARGARIAGRILEANCRTIHNRPAVRLRIGGRTTICAIHVLVCEAFHGPRPPGQVVRHLNDDPLDNRECNLAWGTPKQNCDDMIRNGHAAWQRRKGDGTRCYKNGTPLTAAIAREVRFLHACCHWSKADLITQYECRSDAIDGILHNRHWPDAGVLSPDSAEAQKLLRITPPSAFDRPFAGTQVQEIRRLYTYCNWTKEALCRQFKCSYYAIVKVLSQASYSDVPDLPAPTPEERARLTPRESRRRVGRSKDLYTPERLRFVQQVHFLAARDWTNYQIGRHFNRSYTGIRRIVDAKSYCGIPDLPADEAKALAKLLPPMKSRRHETDEQKMRRWHRDNGFTVRELADWFERPQAEIRSILKEAA